ncbi:hypothetical protein HK104_011414 [Borealophlyctis nickersoniae]|nr:hypothetical protein HK104_011414 [Borealophlyctis nickersoniae]
MRVRFQGDILSLVVPRVQFFFAREVLAGRPATGKLPLPTFRAKHSDQTTSDPRTGCWDGDQCHEIILTDLDFALPLLQRNIDANFNPATTPSHVRIHATRLAWGNVSDAQAVLGPGCRPFDLIIAADVVYWRNLFDPLISTLIEVCSHDAEVLIAYKKRQIERETEFFEKFGKFFEFEAVGEAEWGDGLASVDGVAMCSKESEGQQYYIFKCRKRKVPLNGVSDTFLLMEMMSMDL